MGALLGKRFLCCRVHFYLLVDRYQCLNVPTTKFLLWDAEA